MIWNLIRYENSGILSIGEDDACNQDTVLLMAAKEMGKRNDRRQRRFERETTKVLKKQKVRRLTLHDVSTTSTRVGRNNRNSTTKGVRKSTNSSRDGRCAVKSTNNSGN